MSTDDHIDHTEHNDHHAGHAGHGEAPDPGQQYGAWTPTPQSGEYESDATAFVQLPPDFGLDAAPLAAPGHGYVPPHFNPPMITPLIPAAATDPAATGSWAVRQPGDPSGEQVVWPEPGAAAGAAQEAAQEPASQAIEPDPHATAQWSFTEALDAPTAPAPPAAPSELTGQWTIPVAQGDLPDESGEFTTSALLSQWGGGTPPATLPGGAPAPWAAELAEAEAAEAAEAEAAALAAAQEAESEVAPVEPGAPAAPEVHGPPTLPGGAPAPWATETAEQAPQEPTSAETVEPALPEEPVALAAEAAEAADAPEALEALGAAQVQAPQETPSAPETPAAPEAHEEPAAPPPAPATPTHSSDSDEHPHTSYVLRVNGTDRPVTDSWIGESLLYVLRERLGLAGAKDGCSQGECGACNVQVDGRLVASCLVPAATAAGSEVRTVEGLAVDGEPSDVQRALAKCGAVQCGFCIPGMAMTVHDLLEGNHAPSELETRQALCGNLCRCSGYRGVLDAVREVVAGREASAAAASAQTPDEPRIPHQVPHPHDGGMA
ncbi:(2Fe-2S)-binding protein [Streptomyces purpureus]|uniref:(2Fe-2S)-binding protein n=1 Tax=Streptomyces purpureus TaxID=1951 RepID=UPI0003705489|nr:(2Fe-2S)-binding protein [Streptomyces purpureus]